jgi:hypothetical protein
MPRTNIAKPNDCRNLCLAEVECKYWTMNIGMERDWFAKYLYENKWTKNLIVRRIGCRGRLEVGLQPILS